MRILLDENLPTDLDTVLPGHDVLTVRQMGWLGKENGELLSLADSNFEVFVTGDRNLQYQQNLGKLRNLAIVVLLERDNRAETMLAFAPHLLTVLWTIQPCTVTELSRP